MSRDNILLITTDQQRFDTIQALGASYVFTPHLNYLAAEGISFTNCYSDCPICVPSRTTIMIGNRGYESGVVSNAAHTRVMMERTDAKTTLPSLLTNAGYQTKAMGKMHFSPARAHYGFEEMTLPLDYMRMYDKNQECARPKIHGVGECEIEPVLSTVDVKDSITTWTVDGSVDFLETRDPTRPFFLWTSFTKPHPPFDPCRDYWELYRDISVPEPIRGDWSKTLETTPQGFLAGTYENTNIHLFSSEQIRASRRAYYALITQIDYALGRLFGCLREQNLLENTWVIFTSDHGEMLGDHFMAHKNLFFEGSAHVPLIIMPPLGRTFERNCINPYLAEINDIYPTILSIAGIPLPSHATGTDLMKLCEDRSFFGTSLNQHFCVMEHQMKLIYCACGGHTLLFDLKKDPYETHDCSHDPEYQEVFAHLWEQMMQKIETNLPDALNEDHTLKKWDAPSFPGQTKQKWCGFHYHDYTIDTFH